MQQYLNIPHPAAAACLPTAFIRTAHRCAPRILSASASRCEIAVRLGRDLMPLDAPFTADKVVQAIDAYLPAIEIVDDRYADWQTLGAPTLVADDFFAAAACSATPWRDPQCLIFCR